MNMEIETLTNKTKFRSNQFGIYNNRGNLMFNKL